MSEATRLKISKLHKNRKRSLETKRKQSLSHSGKILSESHKLNLSKAMTGRHLSDEHKKILSQKLKGRVVTESTKEKIRIARRSQILPTKDTKIEIRLQEALTRHHIDFSTHKNIVGQPDIFIEPNLCIFADGDYWHRRSDRIRRDEYVNRKLLEEGYIILRFWETDILNKTQECIDKILDTKKDSI